MSAFTFQRLPNEDLFDAWVRFWDELLAEGPISDKEHPERLASFLDVVSTPGQPIGVINGVPVAHVETWRTNCAMTQHAAMAWFGRQLRAYVNAEPIDGAKSYLELVRGDTRWKKNDGVLVPAGPAIAFVEASPRLPWDHVCTFGRPIDGRHFTTYEGGGGDGTRVARSSRHLDELDSYERRIAGWWEIADLLASSPPEQTIAGVREVGPLDVEDLPETLPGKDA